MVGGWGGVGYTWSGVRKGEVQCGGVGQSEVELE